MIMASVFIDSYLSWVAAAAAQHTNCQNGKAARHKALETFVLGRPQGSQGLPGFRYGSVPVFRLAKSHTHTRTHTHHSYTQTQGFAGNIFEEPLHTNYKFTSLRVVFKLEQNCKNLAHKRICM